MTLTVVKSSDLLVLFVVFAVHTANSVSNECLKCICKASSGCKGSQCEGDACGPYKITWAYWADAGKPTLNGQSSEASDAFTNCANNHNCAARAVQGYMDKFSQDCNGDGVVNCLDHMAIHKKGGYGCAGNIPSAYANAFHECFGAGASHRSSNGNPREYFHKDISIFKLRKRITRVKY